MNHRQHGGLTERQRGFLGAFLLVLAFIVGQFATLERRISFRPGTDPGVSRAAADKTAGRGALPRPLSAGGSGSNESWLSSGGGADRRVAKVKATGSGSDPAAAVAFIAWEAFSFAMNEPEPPVPVLLSDAALSSTPRHSFEGRAPPAPLA